VIRKIVDQAALQVYMETDIVKEGFKCPLIQCCTAYVLRLMGEVPGIPIIICLGIGCERAQCAAI